MGLSFWTTGVLTLFRLDGLALGAFLAVALRQPGGLERAVFATMLHRIMISDGGRAIPFVSPSDRRGGLARSPMCLGCDRYARGDSEKTGY
jgi:hypothetical protein